MLRLKKSYTWRMLGLSKVLRGTVEEMPRSAVSLGEKKKERKLFPKNALSVQKKGQVLEEGV